MRTFWILPLLLVTACHSGQEILSGSQDSKSVNENSSSFPPPAPGESAPADSFRKGVTLVCWSEECFQDEAIERTLIYLQGLGVEWLAIVPTWYQETEEANEIFGDEDRSPTTEDLQFIIRRAKEFGFQILLKPHVNVLDGSFRGDIDPDNLALWQASYRAFILHFAEFAQEEGVEIFSVGTELEERSRDASFWIGLIDTIREIFSGPLTYSANWTEYDSVRFWNRLDFIGIDFYYPLTDDFDATQGDMEIALEEIGDEIREFSLLQQRPVLLTEIGYRSIDGANTRPYDFHWDRPVDLQEQADAYAAVLTTFFRADWLQGIFWWRADPELRGGRTDDDYFFYDKPAAEILRRFWNR